MIGTLLVLHLAVLALLFKQVEASVGRILGLVFLVYMLVFTVVKPALLYYYDLYLPYSTNDDSAVTSLLVGSLIFLVVQSLALRVLMPRPLSRHLRDCFDLSGATPRGVQVMFLVFMVVSFVGGVLRFHDVGYLWSGQSTFDATASLAGGSWYINYIAEMLVYGTTAATAYTYYRHRTFKSLLILIGLLALTYMWSKLVARTGVLVALIAWLSCYFSPARQRALNILYIAGFGYVLLILLYVGNFVRLGNIQDINPQTALFGAVVAAGADIAPVDNATLLYAEMDKHPSTDFVQLAGAATPLVLVPSSIFPFKIPPDKDSELNRIFFPEGADTAFYHEGSMLTFTVPASGYADAGFIGVAVSSLVYAVILCVYARIFRYGTASARYIAASYLLIHIVGYRLSVETMLMSFWSSFLFIGIARWIALTASHSRQPLAAH